MKPNYEFKNLTKQQQACLTLIESLGIYELRALARVFGDASPTTIKRNDHINIVMNKIISGEDLKPLPVRQGRPYKELSNIEGILAELSQITGKDYTLKTYQQINPSNQQKYVSFKQAEQEILQKKLYPIEVRGVVRANTEKELYLISQDSGKHILVKKEVDQRIQPNDYITGTAVVMNADKEYTLETVKTINYQNEKSYKDHPGEYVLDVPTVLLKGTSIMLGGRYILSTGRFVDESAKIKKLVANLKEQNTITLALIPNVMYEDFMDIQALGFNNAFLIKYDDRPFNSFDVITTFIDHVTRLQEQGRNVAIFVQDITTLANGIDFAFKNNTKALMGHTEMSVECIKKIVKLAKAGQMQKHTTFFTTCDNSDMFDQTYVSTVYKVSKKVEL